MKKNWNNPELKNLELKSTNEGETCTAVENPNSGVDRDGIHFFGCHHGLGYNATNCPHIRFEGVIGVCDYVSQS